MWKRNHAQWLIARLITPFSASGGNTRAGYYGRSKNGALRYGQLRKMVEGVSTKMLSQALIQLKEDGLIHRKAFFQAPPKVEYWLTDAAHSLLPSINLLRVWVEHQISK